MCDTLFIVRKFLNICTAVSYLEYFILFIRWWRSNTQKNICKSSWLVNSRIEEAESATVLCKFINLFVCLTSNCHGPDDNALSKHFLSDVIGSGGHRVSAVRDQNNFVAAYIIVVCL